MTSQDCSGRVSAAGLQPFLQPAIRLDRERLDELVEAGEVLDYKEFERPSVIRCRREADRSLIVKLWYRKPKFSSDRLIPYNNRFVKNAAELRSRGVVAPAVIGWGRIEPGHIRFVSYEELPGAPLDQALEQVDLDSTARFVLTLHEAGIDFRSLHLGNILRDESGAHSLIDVTDCSFSSGPLPLKQRIKRLGRFCDHRPDREYFEQNSHWSVFVAAYCQAMQLSPEQTTTAHDLVRSQFLG